jgi:hypothetical protein
MTDTKIFGGCPGVYTIERIWTAVDESGNASSPRVQNIYINDTTAPVLTCINYNNFDANIIPASDLNIGVTASDNCSSTGDILIELVSEEYSGLDLSTGWCPTNLVRVYSAIDLCGNKSICTQTYYFISTSDCQACIDDPTTTSDDVPFFPVVFDEPDAVWTSPNVVRNGICCFAEGSPTPRCISFNVYLHQDAVGMIFEIPSGAIPGGALYYHIDCGPAQKVGDLICLAGGRFYTVTFCEPGNNPNTYRITSVPGAIVKDKVINMKNENSSANLHVEGLEKNSILWSVKSPLNSDSLLNYLDLTDVENPVYHSHESSLSSITYLVCGTLLNSTCGDVPLMDCTEVTVMLNEHSSIISNNLDLSNKETSNPDGFKVYPNPNTGLFNIEFSSNKSKKALLEIYNSSGQLILKRDVMATSNIFQERVKLSDQANGIYYLRLICNDQIFSKNLIIRKD